MKSFINNKMTLLGIFMMLAIILLAGCGGDNNSGGDNSEGNSEPTGGGEVRGVTDTTIKIANLSDFSGPGVYPGEGITDAVQAYVEYINENGGIHGRKIELINEDNQFSPAGTVSAAKKVINQDKVFGIPVSMGSAATIAIKDYVNDENVPLIGAGESTEFFDPASKYLFGIGTSYLNSSAVAVKYIAEELANGKEVKIGIIGQDDTYGEDVEKGAEKAAEFYDNVEIVSVEFNKRDEVDMGDIVSRFKSSGANYLLIGNTVGIAANILQEFSKQNVEVDGIFGISGNATDQQIFELAGNDYLDVYWGTNSHYGWDQPDQESVKRTMEILTEIGKEDIIEKKNTYFWLGWNNINVFVKGLELAGENLTAESFIEALESISGDSEQIGTLPEVSYGPDDRMSGSSAVVLKAKQEGDGVIWEPQSDFIKPPYAE